MFHVASACHVMQLQLAQCEELFAKWQFWYYNEVLFMSFASNASLRSSVPTPFPKHFLGG